MTLGKGHVVRKGEKCAAYDASKQVALREIKPFRTAVATFVASPGKFSVAPLIDRQREGKYMLKLYFSAGSSEITLYTEEQYATLNDFKPNKSSGESVKGGLYTPDTAELARNFA
jgi:outer membrane biogenesis lipoprotein LolB